MVLGTKLTNLTEPLYRQVHPAWMQSGRPTSQAFKPTAKDAGHLSVARGAKTEPAAAFELYTRERKLESVGVWQFSVSDCSDVSLTVYEDPLTDPVKDDAHAVVDFGNLTDAQMRAKAQVLKARAEPVFVRRSADGTD